VSVTPLARDRAGVDRIPPNELEAEMAVLGSVLIDHEMMDVVAEILEPGDFYASLHETIYMALGALWRRGEPLDKVALAGELNVHGMLDKIGGIAYLGSLMDTVPTAASAAHYAKRVRATAIGRGLIHAGTRITQLGYESFGDEAAGVIAAERTLAAVTERGVAPAPMPEPGAVMDALVERMIHGEKVRIVKSPWRKLNALIGGFGPGELIGVVAPAKVGKTGWMLTMGEFAADEQGPFVLFALEMGDESLERRRLALRTGVSARRQRTGDLRESDISLIIAARDALRVKPLVIVGKKHRSLRAFWRICREVRNRFGALSGIAVDHVGFVDEARDFGKERTETQALDEVYRGMMDLGADFECPAFVVVHPNRDGATERPSRATLQKIRGGGALENHAHTIICPWRADPVAKPHEAELIVVAARDGGEGAIPNYYDGARAAWYDVDKNGDSIPLWFEPGVRRQRTEQLGFAAPGESGLDEYAESRLPRIYTGDIDGAPAHIVAPPTRDGLTDRDIDDLRETYG
jgi:replicative DNA helicase